VAAAPEQGKAEASLRISPPQIAALGLAMTPAAAARYVRETAGFAVVVGRELIAQALDDVVAARAAARQSHAALERMRRLAGTAGADSATARESAERQTTADDAALDLAEAKAAAVLGQSSRWTGDPGRELVRALAAGRIKLLRVTFPLGAAAADPPRRLRVQRLDAQAGKSAWTVTAIWAAPADSSMPGRSYFAVLEKSDATDGERLLAWATGAAEAAADGVLIPDSALVVSGDQYWCYVQRSPGLFVRTPIDIGRPLPGGYFIIGVQAGEPIVTAGAGLLLAREMSGGSGTVPATDSEPCACAALSHSASGVTAR
jgi:hypothetical protein